MLDFVEANPGIDTAHHHAIRYGIQKLVEYISEVGKGKFHHFKYFGKAIYTNQVPPGSKFKETGKYVL